MAPSSQIVVNGITHEVAVEPDRSLLEVLREELGLIGAKPGCGEGACGACTVLLDGQPVRSCTVRTADAIGHSVGSIEGLAHDGRLDPVQHAFLEVGAFQCGYCTPGMILATVALLEGNADPDDDEVRSALQGNVCRCCTYPRILRAVRLAADLTHAADESSPLEPSAAGSEPPATPRRPRRPWDLTPAAERDYFDLLPDGLVVVREAGQARGGRAPGGWTTSSGAWLHVGADGQVTAFSGKVDVGQDNRTALSLRVAEELRVPLRAVRLVMGDTDLCPFDVGTFGSRSMPDAAEHLRRTAASARDCLVGLAAARWNVSAAGLIAEDGCVREPAGGKRSAAYGELVRGLHRLEVSSTDAPVTPGPAEQLVGHAARRRDGLEIVTGARHYPGDVALPGMLHGRVLGPPAFGAVLRSADVAKAAALPGVTVVQDGSFVGVAAPDARRAAHALAAIEADWALMPQPSEAALAAHLRSHPVDDEGWEGTFHHETGDPDTALSSAAVRLAATYTTAYIAHVPLETHVALAAWEGGRLTVLTGTQQPFGLRQEVAEALGVPEADVRVVVPDTGGGFGGKHAREVAQAAARLARAAGRPVKVRWSREEEFRRGTLRPAAVIDLRSGAGRDGAIVAWEMRNTNSGTFGLLGPYEIPNQRLDFQPAAAPLAQGSYRALAATANHFARESHMDELAHALKLDPLELRLRHLRDDRLAAVLRTVAERIGWATRSSTAGHGVGLAGGIEKGARIATAVAVRIGPARRLEVERIVTAFECGAIVHPDGLANQVEGATVMGLGAALFEAIHFADGVITNASISDYRVPRITDVPPIEVILLDRRDLPSTGGGETPIIAIAPALANAIFAATGVQLRALPLVPDGRIPLG